MSGGIISCTFASCLLNVCKNCENSKYLFHQCLSLKSFLSKFFLNLFQCFSCSVVNNPSSYQIQIGRVVAHFVKSRVNTSDHWKRHKDLI